MAELVCDTSALLALHQIGCLQILPAVTSQVTVPRAVYHEVELGRTLGHNVPDIAQVPWMTVRSPATTPPLPGSAQLGPGEMDVLWLTLETAGSIALLDEVPARKVAAALGISYCGTLGLLVHAKRLGAVPAVAPLLDELQRCGFHMAASLRNTVLRTAGELRP